MTYIQTTCNVDCHRPLLSLFFLLSILWSSNIYSIWVLLSMLHYNRTTQRWLTFRRQAKSTTTVCTLLQHCFKLGGRDYLLLYKLHSALQPPSSNSTTSAIVGPGSYFQYRVFYHVITQQVHILLSQPFLPSVVLIFMTLRYALSISLAMTYTYW